MGNTNKFFGDFNNGLGLDLWFEKEPYTSTNNNPNYSKDSRKVQTYVKDGSLPIYTSIFRYRDPNNTSSEGVSSYFVPSTQIYNDDEYVNDTGLIKTIEHLQKWKSTWTDYSEFAYLKNLGVYPTNRLMIARRFASPTPNNIYQIDDSPMATMISWMPEDDNFFSVSYGEEWEQVRNPTFTDLLNNIGSEFGIKAFGDKAEGGGKSVSLPGWTEGLQIELLKGLDYLDYEANNPPAGNPNLIKQSMRRTTVDKSLEGSGLSGKFSIKFVVEYEQKYINGIDPSLVYMDIIQKAMIFGTSKSVFFFNTNRNKKLNSFIEGLISGNLDTMIKAFSDFLTQLGKALDDLLGKVVQLLADVTTSFGNVVAGTGDFSSLNRDARIVVGNVISKYRIKLFGVVQALTGAPSGYWHVTIGNPKKPFFSCGDLYTTNVTLTFGKVLSYNDLPSSIKIEFTLDSARNLGGQEIMEAFNTGQSRTYLQRKRSYVEVPLGSENATTPADINSADFAARKQKFTENLQEVLKDPKVNPGPSITGLAGSTENPIASQTG